MILVCLLVIAGVLAARKLWELPPAAAACAAVALTIFSGGWARIGLGGLPFDRLLLVIVALSFFLRAPGLAHTPRPQIKGIHLLLGLTIMYVIASAVAAGTFTGEVGILSIVDRVGVAPYLMFLLAPAIFAGHRERSLLLATLVGLGAYLGFTAIFESLGPHSLVFPHYIAQADSELRGERAGGPFQSSVSEGFATFACAVAAAIAFTQWRSPRWRCVAAVVAGVCVFACFLTLERGVWLAAVTATLVTALATRGGRRWIVPGILACGLVVGGALLLSPSLSSKASARVNRQVSVWDRENQSFAGLRMIEAKPLFGFGWNRYTSDSVEYFRQPGAYPMIGYPVPKQLEPLHDSYLSYAVELGLVGALLWLVSFLWGMGRGAFSRGPAELRPWKLGLIAISVFFLVVSFFNPYLAPFSVLVLWVWAGVACGSPSLAAQEQRAKAVAWQSRDIVWLPA
ncbi:MAG: O-antigen ligase family protein [Solirubrobacteraceae bacterium]